MSRTEARGPAKPGGGGPLQVLATLATQRRKGRTQVTHWTHVLANVSLVEFVLLAALTTLQWVRHRIRGAGWVALSFAILGGCR